MRELILGGQRSGKSRLAEDRARAWLAASPLHQVVFIATAQAHDDEMRLRIARHQADRAQRLPQALCVEESQDIGAALQMHSDAQTLIIVDCLTLWLTQLMMPMEAVEVEKSSENDSAEALESFWRPNSPMTGKKSSDLAMDLVATLASHQERQQVFQQNLIHQLQRSPARVVLVSNEIGWGVIPLGREVRQFVDELGRLNQAVAAVCETVTLMVAGCAMTVKGRG